MKTHKCSKCGETDPTKFSNGNYYICKPCDNKRCKDVRESRKLNPATAHYERDKKREYRKNNSITDKIVNSRIRAKNKNFDFELDKEFIEELILKQENKCIYSGIEFIKGDKYYNMSIDRIDSSKGYVKENSQLVCTIVNRMKSDFTEDTFLFLIKSIYENKFK